MSLPATPVPDVNGLPTTASQTKGWNYAPPEPEFPWYGVRTKSNKERFVRAIFDKKGYESYLPMYRRRRRWSDRVVTTEFPLFPGYVFCRFDFTRRLPIMTTPGVVSIIACGTEPAPIPDSEIHAIQTVLRSGLATEPHQFLQIGQRVRITQGPLKDLEGILVQKKPDWRLVVSVTMLMRSVSVEIDSGWIATN